MIQDSIHRFGGLSRFLHWFMALLIFLQFTKLADRINEGEHWLGETIGPWHVSTGVTLLVLVALRIAWSLSQMAHRPGHEGPLARFVPLGHGLLYLLMVLMPITGILYMIGNGHGLEAFGVVLVAEGPEVGWAATLGDLHSPLAWLLVATVLGHIGAALYHHFVRRDDTLRRMAG